MNNTRPWSPMPPPENASGCIEAQYQAEGVVHIAPIGAYHFSNGRTAWGHRTQVKNAHGFWENAYPEYLGWRYTGPMVPALEGRVILVWAWKDAPGELRALSTNGGDEDWLALLPDDDVPNWMENGTFGVSSIETHRLEDGRMVVIGVHA
jgi:hypothetical protein